MSNGPRVCKGALFVAKCEIMASWASIAKAAPQPVVPVNELTNSTENLRVAVVDANAIINGIRLENVADRAVTIQEVLDEIRDKQSRQFLATLPFGIDVSEPSEDSLAAGTYKPTR
jgi:RNA-binding protein NOB1